MEWKHIGDMIFPVRASGLETFLSGMETPKCYVHGSLYSRLETFLSGMETEFGAMAE